MMSLCHSSQNADIDQASAWRAFAKDRDLEWPPAIEGLIENSSATCPCGLRAPLFLAEPVCLSDLQGYVPSAPIEDDEWLIVVAGSPDGRILALDYRDPDSTPHFVIVFCDVIEHVHAPIEAVLAHVELRTFFAGRMRRISDPAPGDVLEKLDDLVIDFVGKSMRPESARWDRSFF